MPFAYYDRLSPKRQRTYRKSDRIVTLPLPADVETGSLVERIERGLMLERRADVQSASQQLISRLVRGYDVQKIRVRVLATRPVNGYEELHGLYEPEDGPQPATISVWMRTAQRRQVVAFRTFLRTLIHELCHHLDYELFELEETFHTAGFYKRESSLTNALLASAEGLVSIDRIPATSSPRAQLGAASRRA
jgi:hypothetical protein